MKKKLFLLVAFLILGITSPLYINAQPYYYCPEDLLPYYDEEQKMWGYINLFGMVVVEPMYTKVSPFVENKAIVQMGERHGVLNCEGRLLISLDYEAISNFKNGKVWVMKGGRWGLFDDSGKQILPLRFLEVKQVAHTELSWVRDDKGWGLFDEVSVRFLLNGPFQTVQMMSNECSIVGNDGLFGVVAHTDGHFIYPLKMDKVRKISEYEVVYRQAGKWGAFDIHGQIIKNAEWDSIAYKSPEMLLLKKGDHYGLCNLQGKPILDPIYEEIADFSGGVFRIRQAGKYGYAGRSGKVYILPQFTDAGHFIEGHAWARDASGAGFIGFTGKFLSGSRFTEIELSRTKKYYILRNTEGKYQVLPVAFSNLPENMPAFDRVLSNEPLDLIRVIKDKKVYYFNASTQAIAISGAFDYAEAFQNELAKVRDEGGYGIIKSNGTRIIPLTYDSIHAATIQKEGIFVVFKSGLAGVMAMDGSVCLKPTYEWIFPSSQGLFKVCQNKLWGVVRKNDVVVIPFKYTYLSHLGNAPGTPEWPAIMSLKGKFGLVDIKGIEVLQAKYSSLEWSGENAFIANAGKKPVLISSVGIISPIKAEAYGEMSNGLIPTRVKGKWGYYKFDGTQIIAPTLDWAGPMLGRFAVAQQNGLYGIIGTSGKWLTNPEFSNWKIQEEGLFLQKNERWFRVSERGLIN